MQFFLHLLYLKLKVFSYFEQVNRLFVFSKSKSYYDIIKSSVRIFINPKYFETCLWGTKFLICIQNNEQCGAWIFYVSRDEFEWWTIQPNV